MQLADAFCDVAVQASKAILAISTPSHRLKPDGSAVTEADEAAEAIIVAGLRRILPGVAVVAEEATARGERPSPAASFLLVDPLDGTREFLSGNGEYTVNIALIEDGVPTLGVIAAPALGMIWRGGNDRAERAAFGNLKAWTPLRTRPWPDNPVALISRSHLDADTERYIAAMPALRRQQVGSSIKFCQLAQGDADIYPRFGPTSGWDIAAGHAILAAAGGTMTRGDGGAVDYRSDDWRVPNFIAWGDRSKANT